MPDFESVKLGVCDIHWNEAPEVFLGLTKGGCELSYIPSYHDMKVDQYGDTIIDKSLLGEKISVKVPLAETDLDKIEMFCHLARKNEQDEWSEGRVVNTVAPSVPINGDIFVDDITDPANPIVHVYSAGEWISSNLPGELAVAASIGNTQITLADDTGLSVGDFIGIGLGTANYEIKEITALPGANVVEFTALTKAHAIGETTGVSVPVSEPGVPVINDLWFDVANDKLYIYMKKKKLTFGRKPGKRLTQFAKKLRIHPIAVIGTSEDVIIYKAVNKAPLELAYKTNEERVFECEFFGQVVRATQAQELAGVATPFLWQFGEV